MSLREQVAQELNHLDEGELQQVADYVSFLKLKTRAKGSLASEEAHWPALYAEFGTEDRVLSEAELDEYAKALTKEDTR